MRALVLVAGLLSGCGLMPRAPTILPPVICPAEAPRVECPVHEVKERTDLLDLVEGYNYYRGLYQVCAGAVISWEGAYEDCVGRTEN